MSDRIATPEPIVFILAACQPPGAAIAKAYAENGARVILMDGDAKGLTRIAAQDPDQIETLVVTTCEASISKVLTDTWGAEPLCMVVNLLPLENPGAITAQMRNLTNIIRGLMRGLVAGRGSLVSLVIRPSDPLALIGHGMLSAMQTGSAALGQAVAKHDVRVHVVSLPKDVPEIATDTLLYLGTEEAEQIASTTFHLG